MLLDVLIATIAAVAGWVYLLAGHGWYWRTDQRLPLVPDGLTAPASWPAVTVVIPARDEAEILPRTLPTLLGQDYPGRLTVVVVDDESSDGTGEIAARLIGSRVGQASGSRVIAGAPSAPGWAGKVWAMEQGLAAAGDADYVLFTDADIVHAQGTLTRLVRVAEADERAMVSQMALLRAESGWERLLIPAFVYFFAQLYPFRRVNVRGGSGAAAAGGCMLVRRSALEAAGGLAPIRDARIDDVALGRLLKRGPAPADCWLGLTTEITSVRPYPGLSQVWDMVARSAYTQLGYSPLALVGTALGLAWLYLLPPLAAAGGLALVIARPGPGSAGEADGLTAVGLTGWAIMSATYLPMLRLYRLSPLRAPSLPLIAALYAAMTVSSANRYYRGRAGEWKGRTIPAAPGPAAPGPVPPGPVPPGPAAPGPAAPRGLR